MKYKVNKSIMCKVVPGGWGYILNAGTIVDSHKVYFSKRNCYILHGNDKLQTSLELFKEHFDKM